MSCIHFYKKARRRRRRKILVIFELTQCLP
jgi:hypothetical protein